MEPQAKFKSMLDERFGAHKVTTHAPEYGPRDFEYVWTVQHEGVNHQVRVCLPELVGAENDGSLEELFERELYSAGLPVTPNS
jgi:hypothetical protein